MKTKIVIGSLRNAAPCVWIVEWKKFVILMSSEYGFYVAEKWTPSSPLQPDVVLAVTSVDSEEPTCWRVGLHEDSPVRQDVDAATLPFSTPALDGNYVVQNGGLFCIHWGSIPCERGFQVMLSVDEDDAGAVVSSSSTHPVKPLPVEVLFQIVKHLGSDQLQKSILLSSRAFFNVVTEQRAWNNIDLASDLPCLVDLWKMCELAAGRCLKISWKKPRGIKEDDLEEHKLTMLLSEYRWAKLKKLRIVGNIEGLKNAALNVGLRNGNFPCLETLELLVWNGRITWRVLDEWDARSLKELRIAVVNCRLEDISDLAGLGFLPGPSGFEALEKLHVVHVPPKNVPSDGEYRPYVAFFPVMGCLRDGLLPNLEELKMVGPCGMGLLFYGGCIQQNSLKRLGWEKGKTSLPWNGIQKKTLMRVISTMFPALEMLLLGPGINGFLKGAPFLFMSKLKGIQVPIRTSDMGACDHHGVLFDAMLSLETAWVFFETSNINVVTVHLKHLLGLSHLQAVRLSFQEEMHLSTVTRCLTSLRAKVSLLPAQKSITVVELDFYNEVDQVVAQDIEEILAAFSNLTRLRLTCSSIICPDALGKVISRSFSHLVWLEICIYRPSGFPPSPTRENWKNLFRGEICDLMVHLTGEWVLHNLEVLGMKEAVFTAVIRKSDTKKLPGSYFPFHDAVFACSNAQGSELDDDIFRFIGVKKTFHDCPRSSLAYIGPRMDDILADDG